MKILPKINVRPTPTISSEDLSKQIGDITASFNNLSPSACSPMARNDQIISSNHLSLNSI